MSMPAVRGKLSSAVVAFVVMIATVTFVGAAPADAAPPKPPPVKARKVAPPPKPMTRAQRSAQVARDFPAKAPAKATTTQAAAVAAAALCPAAVAAPARAALAPADYMGFGYSLLYNAAGKCVNGRAFSGIGALGSSSRGLGSPAVTGGARGVEAGAAGAGKLPARKFSIVDPDDLQDPIPAGSWLTSGARLTNGRYHFVVMTDGSVRAMRDDQLWGSPRWPATPASRRKRTC